MVDHTTSGPSTVTFFQVSLSKKKVVFFKKQPSCFSFLCRKLLLFDQQFKGFLLGNSCSWLFPKLPSQSLDIISRYQSTLILQFICTYFWSLLLSSLINSLDPRISLPFKVYPNASQVFHKYLLTGSITITENQKFRFRFFFYNQSISKAFHGNFLGFHHLLGARRNTENM